MTLLFENVINLKYYLLILCTSISILIVYSVGVIVNVYMALWLNQQSQKKRQQKKIILFIYIVLPFKGNQPTSNFLFWKSVDLSNLNVEFEFWLFIDVSHCNLPTWWYIRHSVTKLCQWFCNK